MRSGNAIRSVVLASLVSCLSGTVLLSCASPSGDDSNSDETPAGNRNASLTLALVNVPVDALCLELAIAPTASPLSGKSQLFNITPGTSPSLTMGGLPAGQATITARAFSITCTQVQASTTPTWVSAAPVTPTLVAGQTVSVSIVLRRPGTVLVTATFDDGSLTMSPSTVDFGGIGVGSSSLVAYTVTNPGTTTVTLTGPTISGTDASQFSAMASMSSCVSVLAAGANCSGVVIFQPSSAGTKNATLAIGTGSASLTGIGVSGALVFSPSSLNFGNVAVGSSASLTITVTNAGSAAVDISSWSWGSYSSGFSVGSLASSCTSPMAPGATCTRVLTFTPTSTGVESTSLVWGGSSLPLTGTGVLTPVYRINCGSSSAVSPFAADQYYSGGTQHSVTNTINLSGVTNPAPQAVYQTERYGNVTYTFPNLTASAQYTIRLHFAELYQTAAGKRVFNVAINGTTVLSNFDIYAAASGNYKALVREFAATASSSGQIAVKLTSVTDNASISGIEILK